MTATEFNTEKFQTDDIIEITFNDRTKNKFHLWNGHAFSAGERDGLNFPHIRVIGGDKNYDNINLEDVKMVSLDSRIKES